MGMRHATWWYIALLLPTLVFKFRYLSSLYHGEISAAIGTVLSQSSFLGLLLSSVLLILADVLEVALIVGACVLLSRLLLKGHSRVISVVSVFVFLLLGAANIVSLSQLGAFLTLGSLRLSVNWARENPAVVLHVLTPRKLGLLVFAAAWSSVPLLIPRFFTTREEHQGSRRFRTVATFAAGATVLIGACLLRSFGSAPRARAPVLGFWSSSFLALIAAPQHDISSITPPSRAHIDSAYRALAFPDGSGGKPAYLISLADSVRRPRHVLIVTLETAPRKYYSLIGNRDLPTCGKMAAHSIVSDRHQGASPYTTGAVYSILTGTYANRPDIELDSSARTDALPAVLRDAGYETTYIDSYRIDWNGGGQRRQTMQALGFTRLLEAPSETSSSHSDSMAVEAEKWAFGQAATQILDADARGRKSLVVLATVYGHYPWRQSGLPSSASAGDRLHAVATMLDERFAELLRQLQEHGVAKDVIIVITGDHGLRYGAEFGSLGETMRLGDVSFNVPLLIYAPGMVDATIRIPWVTSHIDITPTLLYLLGIDDSARLYHGGVMLDTRLSKRVTFLLNQALVPVDGFYWQNNLVSVQAITGEVDIIPAPLNSRSSNESRDRPPAGLSLTARRARQLVEGITALTDTTAAYFAHGKPSTISSVHASIPQ